jgi:hypothetical protein
MDWPSPIEDSAGECDALNKESGAHGRHRRQGFRLRRSPTHRQARTPYQSMHPSSSSPPWHPTQTPLERHRHASCHISRKLASTTTPLVRHKPPCHVRHTATHGSRCRLLQSTLAPMATKASCRWAHRRRRHRPAPKF